MIASNELRIGNYFQWSEIASMGIGIDFIKRAEDIDKHNQLKDPIPLTEEWLVKLGFDIITENNDGTKNYWNKHKDCSVDVETYLLANKIEVGFRYRIYERKRTKQIIYVHTLQNLYFALTGQELTYKP